MYIKKPKNKIGKKGFTLVETLVAVFILVISIAGPMSFVNTALQSSYYSRDQITAFYLAQEVMELVKNERDTNVLSFGVDNWLLGSSSLDLSRCIVTEDRPDDEINSGVGCSLYYDDGIKLCTNDCQKIEERIDNLTTGLKRYGYGGGDWEDTRFGRKIKIKQIDDNNAIVTVYIDWRSGVIDRKFSVQQLITSWAPL